ncbi:T9SS type A sorting domain-containing protein [bacterium]|nr:T9SS type A sorting domain-containing protein [bacterium]
MPLPPRSTARPSRARPLSVLVLALLVASAPPVRAQTAFRFSTLTLQDPHTYASLPFLGCRDITDVVPLGLGSSFNEMLADGITMDQDLDGSLDLNGLIYLVPQGVVVGTASHMAGTQWNPEDADGELIFHFGACTPPFESPLCEPDMVQPFHRLDYANDTAPNCLDIVTGTLNSLYAAPQVPDAPCLVTEPFDMTLHVGAIPVPLSEVQIGATYLDTVPPRLVSGLVRGFLRESTADSVLLPESIAIVGGLPLSALLPGSPASCATHDDRDSYLGEMGWWVYLNFEADEVPFTAVTGVLEPGSPAPLAALRLEVAPNPFRGAVTFSVAGSSTSPTLLDVLDVRGRVVRSLGTSLWSVHSRDVAWDGTDGRGVPVSSGVYFVRLESDGERVVRKIVRTR